MKFDGLDFANFSNEFENGGEFGILVSFQVGFDSGVDFVTDGLAFGSQDF